MKTNQDIYNLSMNYLKTTLDLVTERWEKEPSISKMEEAYSVLRNSGVSHANIQQFMLVLNKQASAEANINKQLALDATKTKLLDWYAEHKVRNGSTIFETKTFDKKQPDKGPIVENEIKPEESIIPHPGGGRGKGV